MARTSCGLTWSAPMTVPTTWTSLRKPVGEARAQRAVDQAAGEDGRVGGRPSRRKNEPGILPAAYMRSSTSTVRGKKSMPSRTDLAALAVTRTMVSPMLDDDGALGLRGELAGLEGRVLSVPGDGRRTR